MLKTLAVAGLLVLLFLACIEAGRRIRMRYREEDLGAGFGVIDGAVFGLLGLLLAFTFSGAAARFDTRRQLIVQESNAIGTAYLRLDLLPGSAQPQMREDMRRYVDKRLAFYKDLTGNRSLAMSELAEASTLQQKIWSEAIAATRDSSPAVISLVAASLNDMIDITTTRSVALETHPPWQIYLLLLVLAVASSLIAGFGMGSLRARPWLHAVVYAVALAITLYTIMDLEFPRYGVIRVDRYDRALIDQRNSMN